MEPNTTLFGPDIVRFLKGGGIAIIPTDTLYGIVGSALLKDVVERIFALKGRDPTKPCIVLIADREDLRRFGIEMTADLQAQLGRYWPGPVSILLPVPGRQWAYLHRGTGTVACRVPADSKLRGLLEATGPLVAPSANPEGERPAETIAEAKMYFGGRVDFYVDGGRRVGKPSTLIEIRSGEVDILREGRGAI